MKPAVSAFEGLVENEYLCLHAASTIGLLVPRVEIRRIKDITYLLIERYDRLIQDNHIARIHQEDFCQALGIVSTRKYQNEGGPSFKQCFELLQNTTQPVSDLNRLASGLIYNYLICNMDAHGKNFSLLHNASQLSLAPFYDMLCTRFYPTLSEKMAMKIGSKYHADLVLARHWEQFCEDIHYAYPELKRLIKKQGEAVIKALESNQTFYIETTKNAAIVRKIIEIVVRNTEKVLRIFE